MKPLIRIPRLHRYQDVYIWQARLLKGDDHFSWVPLKAWCHVARTLILKVPPEGIATIHEVPARASRVAASPSSVCGVSTCCDGE
jgi:hypothetical protein